ncbi:S8 family serine peptidase [Litorisediminicola beolgyonensis]|uniref:S8 family serine peptidase n=1 Tax=Litorisediminicola beolgyonensis TaxID=1173614 RepID=A0ABW3ZJU4_9RHOB
MTKSAFLQVFCSDPDLAPVSGAAVEVSARDSRFTLEETAKGVYQARDIAPGRYTLTVKPADGALEAHEREIRVSPGPNSELVSLGGQGDLSYPSADGPVFFRGRDDAILLAIRDGEDSEMALDKILDEFGLERLEMPGENGKDSDFALVKLQSGLGDAGQQIDGLVSRMRRSGVEVIPGAVIARGKETPLQGLTNQILIRFTGDVGDDRVQKILREFGLRALRTVTYAGNSVLAERAGSPDYDILELAAKLGSLREVEYAEPQVLQVLELDAFTPNDPLYGLQTHLPLINADEAWDTLDDIAVSLRGGRPDICIAVFDPDGVTPNHPDLTANLTDGTSKLLTSFNFRTMTAQTVAGLGGDHGTQVAGTATAAFSNTLGIAGVAPNCRLIGARLPSPATGIEMADAFIWAAGFNTGNTTPGFPALPSQPADVIANSWGSLNAALSNALRDGLDFLTVYGRGGRGCVTTFSTGNLGYQQFSNIRRFAAYERTIAVGASIGANPTSPVTSSHADPNGNTTNLTATTDRRAFYSPWGPEMDIVAPSHTCYAPGTGLVDPTVSTVRVGTGAMNGAVAPAPATANDYDATFGGTSHASPTIAGAAALVLSTDPTLNWVQVREILRTTAVRIDAGNTDPIGQYVDNDGDGVNEFSQWYGYGRVDVDAAVISARDGAFASDVVVRENLGDTGAVPSPGWHAASPDIWVRASDDPVPALAYGAAPPHQNAVRNQDNFVFARVKNTGVATASEVYLRAMICHYPGFEFRYPQEFIPSVRPGDPVPNPLVPGTYLIDEVRVDDLLPGEDRIVKMTWPAALVPPATVTVGGSTVNWHPCLLLEASPFDGPEAPAGSAIDIRRFNNICQRNIGIDDPSAGGDSLFGLVGGFLSGGRTVSLVVDLSDWRGKSPVLLRLADPKMMERLLAAAKEGKIKTGLKPLDQGEEDQPVSRVSELTRVSDRLGGAIRFPGGALMELELADRRMLEMVLAPDTRLRIRDALGRETTGVRTERFKAQEYVALQPGGVYELPVLAGEGQLFPVIAGAPGGSERGSEMRLTQRRSDGALSAGYAIRS